MKVSKMSTVLGRLAAGLLAGITMLLLNPVAASAAPAPQPQSDVDIQNCIVDGLIGTDYAMYPTGPWVGGNGGVFAAGDLWMARTLCGAQVHTVLQTKACGFWGCSWEDMQDSGWINAYEGWSHTASSATCRSGTNRYRTKFQLYVPRIGGDPWGGYITRYSADEPEFTC